MINKLRDSVHDAVARVPDGASIAVGGFGNAGVPRTLINALCELGRTGLHIVSNNAGIDPTGVGRLAGEGRIRKFTGSFPTNDVFTRQLMTGEAELELVPQGTLAERLRAAGAGIFGFYTPTSAGTILADGTYPAKYDANGTPVGFMAAKEQRKLDGRDVVLEYPLHVDFAFVHAYRADRLGNLQFRYSSRNFNLPAAMAADYTIVDAEEFVEVGELEPDYIHLPGIYVDDVVPTNPEAK
jgi:3-oxoacid CoA-transferase subunit A